MIAIVCLALPLVVAATSARLLRGVTTTPLGVVSRVRRVKGPSVSVGILILAGLGMFAVFAPLVRFLDKHDIQMPGWLPLTMFYPGVASAAIGVAVGAGWIAYTAGRLLRRYGRSPSSQLAAGRLVADPWQGTNFSVMAAVDDARNRADAVAQGLPPDSFGSDRSFYTNTTLLVGFAVGIGAIVAALGLLVSLSEAIVSRRRTYAALVASVVPRSVLVRTQLWQTMSMALPALLLAAAVGVELARALFGTTVSGGGDQIDVSAAALAGQPVVDPQIVTTPTIVYSVRVPWHGLEVVLGGSIAAVLVTIGIGLLFLRASTSVEELRTG